MFKEHLARYQEKNGGALPEFIIYYRDGLSEGQFQQILNSEGRPLKSRLRPSKVDVGIPLQGTND
jgi:hypothetical protein